MCKSQKRELWKLQLFHWWAISGQVYSIDDRPRSYWGKGTCGAKFQEESPLIVPTASVAIHDSMGWYVLSSLPPLSPPDKLLLPTPPSLFQTPLLCECFSPLSILSAPGNLGHCVTRPRFQVFGLLTVLPSSFGVWLYLEGSFHQPL